MDETTKQLLTTIAENRPKIKELGHNEGYEAGKKAQYDEFWDTIQNYGNRTWYSRFCYPAYGCYKVEVNPPKYDFKGELYGCFCQAKGTSTVVRLLEANDIRQLFRWNISVATCPELNIKESCLIEDAFFQAVSLKNINVTGIIATNFDIQYSPLTVDSVKSIISCLKDFSGTANEYKYTVTFKTSAFNALEAEGATAEYNGVACTWAELIDNKKWNLTLA